MHRVAVDAGERARLVRAARPEEPVAFRVAAEAGAILFLDRVLRVLGETDGDGVLAAAGIDVRLAWAVAGFAAKFLRRGTRMGEHDLAHRRVLETAVLIVMTGDAGV